MDGNDIDFTFPPAIPEDVSQEVGDILGDGMFFNEDMTV
jgi:hypothetical protein